MKKFSLIVIVLLLITACGRPNPFTGGTSEAVTESKESGSEQSKYAPLTETTENEDATETGVATEKVDTPLSTEGNPDPQSIDLSKKPNEGGKIMVLMYHNIGDEEEEWVRTPENFRRDLEVLYEKGYRPIKLTDYVAGKIDTPAGLTPYVITFDDARENNFRYLADGSIDPNCAVGILMDFASDHPDFKPHATFFVNGPVPFRVDGEEKEKVQYLIDNGMDIGNHSYGHEDYTHLDGADLQESIGWQANYLTSVAPDGYQVNTLALPFGSRPQDSSLTHYLKSGEYEGKAYENVAVLDVGWDPWYSPFHSSFDPYTIHRVRASETNVDGVGMYDWMDYFDNNPEERFISDGDPRIVSAPADWADVMTAPDGKTLYLYNPPTE